MATHKVSDASFEKDVLQSDTPVVVDFWAEWCGPCKMIAPALEEIALSLGPKAKIVKINIDENPSVPSQYGGADFALMLPRMDLHTIVKKVSGG